MKTRCGNCDILCDVAEDLPLEQASCSACGSQLLLDEQRTQTHFATEQAMIGHFQLLERQGTGSFGTVWKARDTELDRIVAIKIPHAARLSGGNEEVLVREARAAAQLRHPHIVAVHEIGRVDGGIFIVADFVQGVTLKEWLQLHGVMPLNQATRLCIDLAGALEHAHRSGVVHRDLKPENIMLDVDGKPYVLDFGLAKRDVRDATLTVEGRVMGTPAYMSPEQASGRSHAVDGRTDVYSLGVVLFELITGERPFRGEIRMLIYQILSEQPPRPRRYDYRIPRDLETICLKCLEKEPARRYSTAAELADDLRRFSNSQPIQARRVGTLGMLWRWYRCNPYAATITAGGYATFLGVVYILWACFGVVIIGTGFHPMRHPTQAIAELLGLIGIVYIPVLVSGFKTLNRSYRWLYLGVTLFATFTLFCVLVIANQLPAVLQMEVLRDAQSNDYVRFQLFGLLGCLSIIGLLGHVVALANRPLSGFGASELESVSR